MTTTIKTYINKTTCHSMLLLFLASLCSNTKADENIKIPLKQVTPPIPNINLSEVGSYQIEVKEIYNYKIYKYEPHLKIVENETNNSFDTPEATLKHLVISMKEADYNNFLIGWDKYSVDLMLKRNKKFKRNKEFWEDKWEKSFANKEFFLEKRIETGPYIILSIIVRDVKNSANQFPLDYLFNKENNKWLATHKLMADPVFNYWSYEGYVIERVRR